MTTRAVLPDERKTEAVLRTTAGFHADVVERVRAAVVAHDIVIVGMAQNPHVKKARAELTSAQLDFEYVEYGSYLSKWRERLAIKLWSGWPTFPQVFVKGTLIGGANRLKKALEDGSLQALLDEAA